MAHLARALLIALLLLGSSGSVFCQARCLQIAGSSADTADAAAPHHAACHGEGTPASAPLSEGPGESCGDGCCTVLANATVTPEPLTDPAPTASLAPARIDLAEGAASSGRPGGPPRAACLDPPFRFRNPPLLL